MTFKRIWKAKFGRISKEEAVILANTFDEAVEITLQLIKSKFPNWSGISKEDIISLTKTDELGAMSGEDEK